MSGKKHKGSQVKVRDWQSVMMYAHTKPGAMKDRKKDANKKACRGKVRGNE